MISEKVFLYIGDHGIGEPHYHNLATYKEYLKSQSDKLNKLK